MFRITIGLVGLLGFVASGCSTSPNTPEIVSVKGDFQSVHGETGEQSFGITYATPPKVTLTGGVKPALDKTVLLETTTTKFKWKNTGDTASSDGKITWEASGQRGK